MRMTDKKPKKAYHIKIILILLILALFSEQINALGIASDYFKDNTISIIKGESKTYGIRLQNPSTHEVKVALDFDREFLDARNYQQEYAIQPMSSKSIIFDVKVPKGKKPGAYNADYKISQIGPSEIALQLGNSLKIEVQKDPKEEIRKRNIILLISSAALIMLLAALLLLKRKKKELYGRIRFYWGWAFRIFMLIFGVFNLFDYFDFTGKILSAFMLFLLWREFEIFRFLFGTGRKWLDNLALLSFYIFILDTFTRIIRTAEINFAALESIKLYLSVLPEPIYNFVISSSIFVYNSGAEISLFSANAGLALLAIVAVLGSILQKYGKDSVIYSLMSRISRKEDFWSRYSESGISKYTIIKSLTTFAVLLLFSHYFFNLVNQWFIVTIGNSTFIIAFFLSIKDLKNTGIKVLDRMGSFDEELILLAKKIFYSRKYVIFGFSVLLVFHYISDATLFFVPYFIPNVPMDRYYADVLNQGPHMPLTSLFDTENVQSAIEKIYYFSVYLASAIGLLFLFMIPVILLFLFVLQKHLNQYLEKRYHRIVLYAAFITSSIFLLSPWTEALPIIKDAAGNFVNVQGVDFITTRISDSGYSLIFLFTVILVLAGIAILFFNSKKLQEYVITITFLYSLTFLGKYIWNFYLSTFYYYTNILKFSIASQNLQLIFLFSALFLLETLFYIGGFLVLGYHISRYIITEKTKGIMGEKAIFTYTALFFLVPALILYGETAYSITSTSTVIISLLIFSFALYKEFKKGEYRDDYILGVSIVIALLQIIVITSFYARNFSLANLLYFITFSQPAIILAVSYGALTFFRIRLQFLPLKYPILLKSALLGLVFGAVFYLVTEPSISNINMSFNILLAYLALIAVSEEVLFRGMLLNLAERAFSFETSVLLQALVFSSAHFISISTIFSHYGALSSSTLTTVLYVIIYYVLLYSFAMVASFLYGREDRNITYPIIFHFVTNLFIFLAR